jgi:hypothetical protein
MRRLATFGHGWIPWGPDAADITAGIPAMRTAVAELGRDPAQLAVVGMLPVERTGDGVDLDATMARVPALVEAGVTDFRAHLPVPSDLDPALEYLTDVVERFTVATS